MPEALDGDSPHLLSLSLRVTRQTRQPGRQEHLERIYPSDVGRKWDYGYDAAPEALGPGIGSFIGDDDYRAILVGFGTPNWFEVGKVEVAPLHWSLSPSPTVDSQSAASPDSSHSFHAAS